MRLWSVFEMFGMIWHQFSVYLKSSFLPRSISNFLFNKQTLLFVKATGGQSRSRVYSLWHCKPPLAPEHTHSILIPTVETGQHHRWTPSCQFLFKECHNTVVQLLYNTGNHWCGVRSMEPQRKPQASSMSMYFNDMPLNRSKYWIYTICCVESTLR